MLVQLGASSGVRCGAMMTMTTRGLLCSPWPMFVPNINDNATPRICHFPVMIVADAVSFEDCMGVYVVQGLGEEAVLQVLNRLSCSILGEIDKRSANSWINFFQRQLIMCFLPV